MLAMLLALLMLSGCWNYRELEQLALISGVAIDQHSQDKMELTVEIVDIGGGAQETQLTPVYVSIEGKTFFDAARRAVTLEGKKLFWSHAKIIVVSPAVAKEGVNKFLDFLSRNEEAREDPWILMSREPTAKEILMSSTVLEPITAFQIAQSIRAQRAIPIYPAIELYKVRDVLASDYESVVMPTIRLVQRDGKKMAQVFGTAIFNQENLAGFLDDIESRSLLFARDEMEAGVYPVSNVDKKGTDASIEIFKSKSKVEAKIVEGELVMKTTIMVEADIGEIMGSADLISHPGRDQLICAAQQQIKQDVEGIIKKVQKEFKTDVLKYAGIIRRQQLQAWKLIEKDWKTVFPELKTEVSVLVKLRRSAVMQKPIKVGK